MPWQRQVVDTALEYDPDTGLLVYRDVVVTVPRQCGKTTLSLSFSTWRAIHQPGARICFTAQDGAAARAKFKNDQVPMLNASPFASGFTIRYSNGEESIRWKNGSLFEVVAPTDRAGHGKSLDAVVLDEIWEFEDFRLDQGFSPAMITRRQPQMWIISTAGTARSTYLLSKVERGRDAVRDGLTTGMAYFEWSAAVDADPADPATWWSCIPSLGHTVPVEAIEAEQRSKEPAEFERAYLNRWTSNAFASKVPARSWEACTVDESPGLVDVVFALDVSPDREFASVAVCDGATFELADRRPGTEWVVSRLVELWDRYEPVAVVVDGAGPGSSLVPDLEAAGVRVEVTSHRQMAAACGRFYDAVVNRKVGHTGQVDLDAAVAGAATRKLGDAWAWSRSTSAVDISPLVAATLALWGATTLEREVAEPPPPVFAY
ncbi:MAG: terminase large subunit domain-containing protein [Ilumatobacteraceae bacterium]